MTKAMYPQSEGIATMTGLCDQTIEMFLFKTSISHDKLVEMQDRSTGILEEGEIIKLHVCPLEDAWRVSPDSKFHSLLFMYDKLSKL